MPSMIANLTDSMISTVNPFSGKNKKRALYKENISTDSHDAPFGGGQKAEAQDARELRHEQPDFAGVTAKKTEQRGLLADAPNLSKKTDVRPIHTTPSPPDHKHTALGDDRGITVNAPRAVPQPKSFGGDASLGSSIQNAGLVDERPNRPAPTSAVAATKVHQQLPAPPAAAISTGKASNATPSRMMTAHLSNKQPSPENTEGTTDAPQVIPRPTCVTQQDAIDSLGGKIRNPVLSASSPLNKELSQQTEKEPRTSQLKSSGEQQETALANLDNANEYRLKNSETASIKHGSHTSWSKSIAKMFRSSKNSGSSAIAADIKETDVVIAIVSRSGTESKHAFATSAVDGGQRRMDNAEVEYVMVKHPHDDSGRNLYFVYTTGTDEKLPDALRSISNWLAESCPDGRRLSGMIYLDSLTSKAVTKSARSVIEAVDKHVERSNVVIALSGWSEHMASDTLEQREKETRDRWRALIDRGVSVLKLRAPEVLAGITASRNTDVMSSDDISSTPRDILNLVLSRADEKNLATRGQWKGKGKKPEDLFMDDPRSSDIVIPIMGPTGVGKSTFINTVAGATVTKVGHNLKSETAQLHHIILEHPRPNNRRVILVDTPGFDDTFIPDSEILRRIAVWLARSYSANMKLAGVVYLHEISQTRMLGTSRKNLDMFNKLCGADATKNVILATTKWSEVPENVGLQREDQLKERHWKYMLDLGSTLYRFDEEKTPGSGQAIINRIIDNANVSDVDAVEIQQELVEIEKILPDTEAGRALLYTLEELLEIQRNQGEQLREDDSNSEVKKRIQENNKKIRATMKQINDMSGPLGHRLKGWVKKLKFLNFRVEDNASKDS